MAPIVHKAAQAARDVDARLEAEDWYEHGCELESSDPQQALEAYTINAAFQFGMEKTKHHCMETLAFHDQPFFQLIGGNVIRIDSLFQAGPCIGTLGTQ